MSGYQPAFDLDLAEGLAAEGAAADLFAALRGDHGHMTVEVKLDRYDNDRVYVELEQQPRRGAWKPSGLNVTTADCWVFVKGVTGVMLVVPTELLRAADRRDLGQLRPAADGDNPTRGRVLRIAQLLNPDWWSS